LKEEETLVVDGENDSDANESDDGDECHEMSLESKVLNGVVATFPPELIVRQSENGQDPGTTVLRNSIFYS
jgi:hypothetical protein